MDAASQGETISDIQNYLESFPKGIKAIQTSGTESNISTDSITVTKPINTYFIDQASGQYYIQQADGHTHQMVAVVQDESADDQSETAIVVQQPVTTKVEPDDGTNGASTDKEEIIQSASGGGLQVIHADQVLSADGATAQVIQTAEGAQILAPDGSGQVQVMLNNDYQTFYLPSSNNAEMSYMFILQSTEGESSEVASQDLTVYDFAEDGQQVEVEPDQEQSVKFSKTLTKKSRPPLSQPHMCQYCNYTSTKRYLLSRHMRTHSEERPHKCGVCERGFKTVASLQNHVNTHTGTKPHRCKYCAACFTTSGELVRHVRYRHTHEKPHRCTECDYSSVELSKLKRHMRCHTGERPYQCPHCTYASPDTFKLKRHLRIHTGEKPYECEICHARFTQSNSLKAHTLIHTGKKPVFQCELCPTTCGRKIDLRIHVQKLHTSDKPLKCKRCGKSFPDRYSFKCHNKTHEGEKCFKCDLCPYASISQRHLESHMLIHTDQKPFHCLECDQSFRQKQLLKRHRNLYHNPGYIPPAPKEKTHQCPECGKAFRHKGNVIRHLAIHDPKSNLQERSLALKLGRQRRIQCLARSVTSDDPLSEENVVAVQGQDGRQYVVLEVIHLQDPDGQHTVAMIPELSNNDAGSGTEGDFGASIESLGVIENIQSVADGSTDLEDEDEEEDEEELDSNVDEPENESQRSPIDSGLSLRKRLEETHRDVQNCFGFDEEEESHSDILSDM